MSQGVLEYHGPDGHDSDHNNFIRVVKWMAHRTQWTAEVPGSTPRLDSNLFFYSREATYRVTYSMIYILNHPKNNLLV